MSSRVLADLRPEFFQKAVRFLAATKKAGLDVLIYCTYRSLEEQMRLYNIGRTLPGRIVTNAAPGHSAHNYGLAFDGAPLIHGRIAWEDHEHWQIYGRIAQEVGLEWAGAPEYPFHEQPHIQMPNWRVYADIAAEPKTA